MGFYLAGIMAVYAFSGIIMIFRNTDTFKKVIQTRTTLEPQLDNYSLIKKLKLKSFSLIKTEGSIVYFTEGQYNKITGETIFLKKELPYIIKKMEQLHKATTDSPIYWLNIFFGVSLLFFVLSAFWMFLPETSTFRKGVYFSIAGIIMTLLILFI